MRMTVVVEELSGRPSGASPLRPTPAQRAALGFSQANRVTSSGSMSRAVALPPAEETRGCCSIPAPCPCPANSAWYPSSPHSSIRRRAARADGLCTATTTRSDAPSFTSTSSRRAGALSGTGCDEESSQASLGEAPVMSVERPAETNGSRDIEATLRKLVAKLDCRSRGTVTVNTVPSPVPQPSRATESRKGRTASVAEAVVRGHRQSAQGDTQARCGPSRGARTCSILPLSGSGSLDNPLCHSPSHLQSTRRQCCRPCARAGCGR